MTSEEKQQILARLASSEAASMAGVKAGGTNVDDEFLAKGRLMQLFNKSFRDAALLYDVMIAHLRRSELCVNLKVRDFFTTPPTGRNYSNMWERNRLDSAHTRDAVEETLFAYTGTQNSVTDDKKKPAAIRMRLFGSRANDNRLFKAGIRPKYGALNYTNSKEGPARRYGKSFFVLKDHVKLNCTFYHMDSFCVPDIPNGVDRLASYVHLQRLLVYMSDNMLKNLFATITMDGSQARTGTFDYLEAQIHTEILFSRDIKRLCISNTELAELPQVSDQLRAAVEKFTKKNNIVLKYIS